MLITTFSNDGRILDQFELKCLVRDVSLDTLGYTMLMTLEEELRSMLLKVFLLENYAQEFPKDGTWTIMFTTPTINNTGANTQAKELFCPTPKYCIADKSETMRSALCSGEWSVDNDCLPENIASVGYCVLPRRALQLRGFFVDVSLGFIQLSGICSTQSQHETNKIISVKSTGCIGRQYPASAWLAMKCYDIVFIVDGSLRDSTVAAPKRQFFF
jgi:hypothetical protein